MGGGRREGGGGRSETEQRALTHSVSPGLRHGSGLLLARTYHVVVNG